MNPLEQSNQLIMDAVKTICEGLMSYPIGKLFAKDNPTGKEKKHEQRCTDCVDKFYSFTNPHHAAMREMIRDIDASLLLGHDERVIPQILEAAGRLQFHHETHAKLVKASIKPEAVLVKYYEDFVNSNLYPAFETLITNYVFFKELDQSYVDISWCKQVYFDAYKDEKRKFNSEVLL